MNKVKFCTNCGKNGHDYKQCTDSVTSIGIILIKFDYDEIKQLFTSLIKKAEKNEILEIENQRIDLRDTSDIELFSILQSMVSFLLICRKHSLGYSEFIRGRYKSDNVDGILFLFQQMVQKEIDTIKSKDFQALWEDFWIDPSKRALFEKDYHKSLQKFNTLNNPNETELTLDFYLNNVKPNWNEPEWGFPKGRRDKMESNIECAMREFEEETGFSKDDYILLEGIKPLTEEFVGTNAIRYKHIYYVAYATNDRIPMIDNNNYHQLSEIGEIGYYSYNETMNMIRPYHTERKSLITRLFMFTCEKIMNELKRNALEKTTESMIDNTNDNTNNMIQQKEMI